MLRPSPPLSVGQASHYYKSEFSRGDYYTAEEGEGIVASRWHGEGADELGLKGRVKAEEFTRVLEGKDPTGRRVLVAHRQGLSERRAGWDVTVSPHKSVSVAALVGGDRRLLEAHDKAVAAAVGELERHVQAWVHGGRDVETTGAAVVASFRHETSRALDPQLHTHCVFVNMTQREDGEWRAVDGRGVFRAQRLAREIYEAELGKELARLGYEVETYRDGRDGRDRAVGIAGFQEEHLRHFSKRSREIEKALAAGGLKSQLHGSRISVATRAAKKKGIDREALSWGWREAAREMSLQFPRPGPSRTPDARAVELATREALEGAVAHLSERRAVFPLAELEREALARGRDHGSTIEDVRREIDRRGDLVVADRGDRVHARVTTREAIEAERALVEAVEHGRGQAPSVPLGEKAARGLGEDQVRVARHVLESTDRVLAVEGKAGTGKSTTLSRVRERAEEAGWKVRGFAPTTTATGVLREGGIESVTVAALNKESPAGASATRPELWVVDEAGLLSTEQARELLGRAEQAGAKVVLVGDRAQHRAVEAGAPFELLIERGKAPVERLETVRRQRDERLREAVVAASEAGGAARSVQLLDRAESITVAADMRERHERITRDFVEEGGRGVVIAPSNAERADLNRRIREALIERGQVEKKSFKAQVVAKRDMTAEQRSRAASFAEGDSLRFVRSGGGIAAGERWRVAAIDEKRNRLMLERHGKTREINPKERSGFEVERIQEKRFAVGDRIQFRERDRTLDVANGTVGTVKRLDHERGMATVDVGGRNLRLDMKEPRALDHAYAVTSHKSQGLSRERVYLTVDTHHSEELVNRRQFYVSVSRAIERAHVYTDDRAALERVVSREQGREGALDLAERASGRQADTKLAAMKRETALDVSDRSSRDERREQGREYAGGRAAGGAGRRAGADRGADEALGRAAREAGHATRAAGAERGRAQGEERVPGPGDAGRARPGGGADREAGRRRGEARGESERPGVAAAHAARGGRDEALERNGEARAVAARGVDRGDGGRGLAGGAGGAVETRDGHEVSGRGQARTSEERAQERAVEGAAASAREPASERAARVLSRERIAGSGELRRLYTSEYASMLRVVKDRELAKDVARVNVSALAAGQERIVSPEARLSADKLKDALTRGGDNLAAIRRDVSKLAERAVPTIERVQSSRVHELGRGR